MHPLSVATLAHLVEGDVLQGAEDTLVSGVSIDNRKVQPGDVFVAFAGENVDGHRFVPDAFARGAAACLISDDAFTYSGSEAIIRIADPLAAVQRLAAHERSLFAGPVIGVTGSNGKTTSKGMLGAVFQVAGPCLYTPANLNNELGLPLTILQRKAEHRTMVLEMGMRGAGQIAALCAIAKPTAGLITNIGHSHIELLGSQEGIAHAKAELLQALPADGIAVLNEADPWLRMIAKDLAVRTLWFRAQEPHESRAAGDDENPLDTELDATTGARLDVHLDAYASEVRMEVGGTRFLAHVLGQTREVFLPTYGLHNVQNALGALLMGSCHGLPLDQMADRLAAMTASSGRLQLLAGHADRLIIDDSYNASPASATASLGVLQQVAGERTTVAILGDMYELGSFEVEGHRLVGQSVVDASIDRLIAIGPKAKTIAEAATERGHQRVAYYPDKSSFFAHLDEIPPHSVVLVKASRGMQFEKIVQRLAEASVPHSEEM